MGEIIRQREAIKAKVFHKTCNGNIGNNADESGNFGTAKMLLRDHHIFHPLPLDLPRHLRLTSVDRADTMRKRDHPAERLPHEDFVPARARPWL
jgi:hypothetical protein